MTVSQVGLKLAFMEEKSFLAGRRQQNSKAAEGAAMKSVLGFIGLLMLLAVPSTLGVAALIPAPHT